MRAVGGRLQLDNNCLNNIVFDALEIDLLGCVCIWHLLADGSGRRGWRRRLDDGGICGMRFLDALVGVRLWRF
jgi:hypothetical protein